MTNPNYIQQMIGRTAVDSDGTKIGKIGQVYLDDQTGQPVWPPSRPACSAPRIPSPRSTAPSPSARTCSSPSRRTLLRISHRRLAG